MIDVDNYAKKVHRRSCKLGKWDAPCLVEAVQRIHTAIADAAKASFEVKLREGLPHRRKVEVAFAEILFQLMDLAKYCKWEYRPSADSLPEELRDTANLSTQFLILTAGVSALGLCFLEKNLDKETPREIYSGLVDVIFFMAKLNSYDLKGVIDEVLKK